MNDSKDLFDDSVMTFGEHLEVLRVHLIKALLGLLVAVIIALCYGKVPIRIMQQPLDAALAKYGLQKTDESAGDDLAETFFAAIRRWWNDEEPEPEEPAPEPEPDEGTIEVQVPVEQLAAALAVADPDRFGEPNDPGDEPAGDDPSVDDEAEPVTVPLRLTSPAFRELAENVREISKPKPVTLTVQEAFMTYVKVAIVSGLILSAPWIFYQLWLFVAAGLYPHERKYVYTYLPMSIGLFLAGALLCYFGVLPLVLHFLFGFNKWLGVEPQIRLTEWINFAIVLPLMFGISFQLPLVMLFLERISIFTVANYQQQRRMSILVIAILSMLLTPADPASMLMMMIPLVFLYELGILLCKWSPAQQPFEGAEPV